MPASKRSRPYYDDRFTDEYVMQNYSDGQKEGSKRTWHDVSVKGPDVFKSSGSERKSDELGIMHNASEFDNHSSGAATIRSMEPSNTIRKNTSYTVQRV